MNKIKILVTASTFPRFKNDSTPRFILDMCKSIEDKGIFECLVMAPHTEGSAIYEVLEGIHVKRYRYFYPYYFEQISGMGIMSKIKKNRLLLLLVPFFIISQIISTIITIKNYNPDILLVNWVIPQGFIAYIMKIIFPSIKIIMVAHGGDIGLIQHSYVLKIISRIVLEKADRIVAVSSFLKDKILRITELKEVHIISSGVDIDMFEKARVKKTEESEKIILFVGRLEEKKGIKYLLEALVYVVKIYEDVKLNIIGDGNEKISLINLAKRLKLEKNVTFYGSFTHEILPDFFEKVIVFVSPSINLKDDIEGLPTTILEAIAAKVPVITTDAGGINDIIENNITGIIVEQENPEELAEKIISLIENKELRRKLSEKAFEKLQENFTSSKISEKYHKLLNELLIKGNIRK